MPRVGGTAARGYGAAHQRERARWAPIVAAGRAVCARCRKPIAPNTAWDLGHDDTDRTRYAGPEHRRCNRRAGARVGAAITNARRRARRALSRQATSLTW